MAVMKSSVMAMPVSAIPSSTGGAPVCALQAWHEIDWRKVYRNVRLLQTRIVKAAHYSSRRNLVSHESQNVQEPEYWTFGIIMSESSTLTPEQSSRN